MSTLPEIGKFTLELTERICFPRCWWHDAFDDLNTGSSRNSLKFSETG